MVNQFVILIYLNFSILLRLLLTAAQGCIMAPRCAVVTPYAGTVPCGKVADFLRNCRRAAQQLLSGRNQPAQVLRGGAWEDDRRLEMLASPNSGGVSSCTGLQRGYFTLK